MKIIKIKPDTNYIIKGQFICVNDIRPTPNELDFIPLCQPTPTILTAPPATSPPNDANLTAGVIYIENGSIVAITPVIQEEDNFMFTNPRRPKVVLDLKQLTIMPPLVDCHVHLALDGIDFAAARGRWDEPEQLTRQIRRQLDNTLSHGILAIRDGGDRRGIAGSYRQPIARGSLMGPCIKASIHGLRPPNSYGSFLGPDVPMEKMAAMLDQLVLQKVDQVKVIVSGVVSFKEYGRVGSLHYTEPELSYIVRLAKQRGLPVMAHASSDPAVALAVKAGVDSIEHGYFLKKTTLEQIAARNIAWVPTVIPVAAQLQQNPSTLDRSSRYVIEKTVYRQLAMLNLAAELGVTIGVGTDAGSAGVQHGFGYLKELQLYRQAGLTAAQIYQSAAVNSAGILKLPWGQIKPGNPAALIAVQGHPLQDIGALSRVKYAFLPSSF